MFHNEGKNVQTCPGIVLWDGITQPETKEVDGKTITVHSLKIAIPANSVEKGELEQLTNGQLQSGRFKGQFPAGGEWPLREIDMQKYAEDAALMTGRIAINANTRLGVPTIYDQNGQELGAMQYGRMLYPGATVALLVHCYDFNNKSKGLAYGLDGIQIIDATTPKLSVGGGMSAAAVGAIFGGGAPAGMPAAGPAGVPQTMPPVAGALPQAGMPGMPGVQSPSVPAQAGIPPAQPHTGFVENAAAGAIPPVAAPAHVMTASAGGATYEAMIAGGWTDATLIQHGHMLP